MLLRSRDRCRAWIDERNQTYGLLWAWGKTQGDERKDLNGEQEQMSRNVERGWLDRKKEVVDTVEEKADGSKF